MPDDPALILVSISYIWDRKVLRFQITFPFQRPLIVKHEGQIDWSGQRIESSGVLDHYMSDDMLSSLKVWITKPSQEPLLQECSSRAYAAQSSPAHQRGVAKA